MTAHRPLLPREGEIEIGFLLLPGFPLVCLSSALDALRHANGFASSPRYTYRTYARGAALIKASNRLDIQTGSDIGEHTVDGNTPDLLFVCAGTNFPAEEAYHPKLQSWLRRLARRGVPLGGISAGTHILAKTGLLDGYRCALHWYDASVFRETFPDIDVTDRLFSIDRDRLTCSGGAATIDMMLRIVADDLGERVASKTAEMMQVERVRSTDDRQSSASLYKAKARSAPLAKAIGAMEANLDAPFSMIELSAEVGLTRRQLHRLFRQYTGETPTDFYRDLRLRHARSLLHGTPAKIIDVATATGFGSHSHFTKVYRERFGISPLKDRHSDL